MGSARKYTEVEIEIVEFAGEDVITSSCDTQTPDLCVTEVN